MSPSADTEYMRRAIARARTHLGLTAENPSVGCVLVRDGAVVGEAVTGQGGRPHAEEQAIEIAGERARGAIAYVTLEPCGARSAGTASCSQRLVEAGVAEVVVACEDASTFAAGKGGRRLAAAGIPVRLGVLAEEAAELYADYVPPRN